MAAVIIANNMHNKLHVANGQLSLGEKDQNAQATELFQIIL